MSLTAFDEQAREVGAEWVRIVVGASCYSPTEPVDL